MNPRVRMFVIAAAIPIALVALISIMGRSSSSAGGGPVVVTSGGGSGSSTGGGGGGAGTAKPKATSAELSLAELMRGGGSGTGKRATPKPTLAPANPAVVRDLMEKGERAYMSGDLATARGYYSKAATLDPECERCVTKRDTLEKQILAEIQDAFRSGENYIKDGRYDQAVWTLERVFALDPDEKSQYHMNAKTLIEDAKAKKAANSR